MSLGQFAFVAVSAIVLALPACTRDGVSTLPDAAFDGSGADASTTRPELWPAGDAKLWDGQPENCGPLNRPCFVGAAFADCGELSSQGPVLFCSFSEPWTNACRWVSDGCPTAVWPWPVEGCYSVIHGVNSPELTQRFFTSYGQEPWTRDRGAVIEATIEDGSPPEAPINPHLRCENTVGEGWVQSIENPCEPGGTLYTETHDTVAFYFMNASIGSGWRVMIEVDTGRMPAMVRICRFYATDYISCLGNPPALCASSGNAHFIRHDGVLHLTSFRAEFPDGAVVFSEER